MCVCVCVCVLRVCHISYNTCRAILFPTVGREVSVNKPASQSKTQVSALFAVDGMLPPESPCAQTVMSLDPWLRIDLEVVHLIYGFYVYTPIAAGIAGMDIMTTHDDQNINVHEIYLNRTLSISIFCSIL